MTDKTDITVDKTDITVVQYGAGWCGPCRQLKPILEEVCKELNVFYKYKDIDDEEVKQEVDNLGLRSIPVIYILDAEGRSICDYKVGIMSRLQAIEWIAEAIDGNR